MSQDSQSKPARNNGQFRKGVSGNPKGRPRKPKEALTPSQLRKDILYVMELPLTVKMPDGEKTLRVRQAAVYAVAKRAIAGDKVSYMKLWLQLQQQAVRDNAFIYPSLETSIEIFNALYSEGSNEPGIKESLEALILKSKGR